MSYVKFNQLLYFFNCIRPESKYNVTYVFCLSVIILDHQVTGAGCRAWSLVCMLVWEHRGANIYIYSDGYRLLVVGTMVGKRATCVSEFYHRRVRCRWGLWSESSSAHAWLVRNSKMLLPDSQHPRRDLTGSEHSLITKSSVSMITKMRNDIVIQKPLLFQSIQNDAN